LKKATLNSTLVWAAAATIVIGSQFADQKISSTLHMNAGRLATGLGIGLLVFSMGLMTDAPAAALFPSKENGPARNAFNVANILAGILGGLSFLYLAGLLGRIATKSAVFDLAVAALFGCIAFQAVFAVVTNKAI
jgi:hypothetical protein